MNKIRKGDQVIVLAGKNKGSRGVVLSLLRETEQVIVENVNMARRHTKGNPAEGKPGGIIEKEMPLAVSNVALLNPVTDRADRVGFRRLEDGTKVRYFKSNQEVVDV